MKKELIEQLADIDLSLYQRSPCFPAYANDWLSSPRIALMTLAQEGAYWRLLCHTWANPHCALKDDAKELAVLSRLGKTWQRLGAPIRECFEPHPHKSGWLIQPRLMEVAIEQIQFKLAKSRAGQKSGAARRNKSRTDDEHSGSRTGTEDEQTSNESRTKTNSSLSSSLSPSSSSNRNISSNKFSGASRPETDPILAAMAQACAQDLTMLDSRLAGRWRDAGEALRAGNADLALEELADLILEFGQWYYAVDFPGKRPTVDRFRDKWGAFLQYRLTPQEDRPNGARETASERNVRNIREGLERFGIADPTAPPDHSGVHPEKPVGQLPAGSRR